MAGDNRTPGDDPAGLGQYTRGVVALVGVVLLATVVLFAVAGVWPPLLVVDGGSMDPHLRDGDLVFVTDEDRFPGRNARHGVVTARQADGYVRFGGPGDVIVYAPNGQRGLPPVVHRAMLYVKQGENWYGRTDPTAVGDAGNCGELANCPAPHAGFVTKGDANDTYDQVGTGASSIVRSAWVEGRVAVRLPVPGELPPGVIRTTAAQRTLTCPV